MSIYGSDSDEEPLQERFTPLKTKQSLMIKCQLNVVVRTICTFNTTQQLKLAVQKSPPLLMMVLKEQSNDLGTLLYENCNKKRKVCSR